MAAHIFSESGQMQEVDIPDIFDVLEGGEDENAVKYLLGFGGEDSGVEPGQIIIEQPQQHQIVTMGSQMLETGSTTTVMTSPVPSEKGPKSGKRDTSGLKAIYGCENCTKAFTTKFNLRRHINMHCHKSKEIGVPIQGPPSASAPSKKPNKGATTTGRVASALSPGATVPIATTVVSSVAVQAASIQTQPQPGSSITTVISPMAQQPTRVSQAPPSTTSTLVTYQSTTDSSINNNPGIMPMAPTVTVATPSVQFIKSIDPGSASTTAADPMALTTMLPQQLNSGPSTTTSVSKPFIQNVTVLSNKVDSPSPTPSLNLSPSMFPLMNSLPEAPMQVFQELNPPLAQSSSSSLSTSSSTSLVSNSSSAIPSTTCLTVSTSSKPLSSFLQSAFPSSSLSTSSLSPGSGATATSQSQLLQIATPSKLAAALPNFTVTLNASVMPDDATGSEAQGSVATEDGAAQQTSSSAEDQGSKSTTLLITATLDPRTVAAPQYQKRIDRLPSGWIRKVVQPDIRGGDPVVLYFSSLGKKFSSAAEIEQHYNRLGYAVATTDIFNFDFSKEELEVVRAIEKKEEESEKEESMSM